MNELSVKFADEMTKNTMAFLGHQSADLPASVVGKEGTEIVRAVPMCFNDNFSITFLFTDEKRVKKDNYPVKTVGETLDSGFWLPKVMSVVQDMTTRYASAKEHFNKLTGELRSDLSSVLVLSEEQLYVNVWISWVHAQLSMITLIVDHRC